MFIYDLKIYRKYDTILKVYTYNSASALDFDFGIIRQISFYRIMV